MKRFFFMLMLSLAALLAKPAEAQRAYFMGNLASNGISCPVSGFVATLLQTNVGYFTNPSEPYPKTGEIAYVRAFGANVSGCVNDVVGFEFFLPEGASLAIDATYPVFCNRGTLDGTIYHGVGNSPTSACSPSPSIGVNGGYYFGFDTVPSGWFFEVRVPVVFNKKLLGLAGPNSHRVSLATSSIGGTVFPHQAVTTFYRAELLNPSSNSVTASSATVAFDLKSYFNSGFLYVDYGTTTALGSSLPPANVPNTSLSFAPTASLAGLNPATTYYWRARFATADGTFVSTTQSFTTTGSASPQTLSVTVSGTGTVVSSPAGINCGATCSASFASGSAVTLTPTQPAGWQFNGWQGGGCTGFTACTVTMSAAQNVTAFFVRQTGSLSISLTGLPAGTVVTLNIAGPDGYTLSPSLVTGTGTNVNSAPTGTYTLTAPPVTVAGVLYSAFNPTQTTAVTANVASSFVAGYRLGGGPATVAARRYDLNGDGKSDLLFRDTTTGEVQAKLMDGSVVQSGASLVGAGAWAVTHTADFNADGKADLLWRHPNGTTILWLMNGTTPSASAVLLVDPSWSITHVGDINGDGKTDILWRNTNGAVIVWLMDGVTQIGSAVLLGADADWRITHVGDFNADGKADILWRHTNGAVIQWLMNGTAVTASTGLLGADPDWRVTHLGDFNNDAKADILWRHTNGTVVQWLMNGAAITTGTTLLADPSWSVSHIGDFNGDNRADILWRNTNGAVTQWLMNGVTVTASASLLGADPNWRVSHIADYNGDGRSDLLWRNTVDGSINMWLMNGATPTPAGILGPSPWVVVP